MNRLRIRRKVECRWYIIIIVTAWSCTSLMASAGVLNGVRSTTSIALTDEERKYIISFKDNNSQVTATTPLPVSSVEVDLVYKTQISTSTLTARATQPSPSESSLQANTMPLSSPATTLKAQVVAELPTQDSRRELIFKTEMHFPSESVLPATWVFTNTVSKRTERPLAMGISVSLPKSDAEGEIESIVTQATTLPSSTTRKETRTPLSVATRASALESSFQRTRRIVTSLPISRLSITMSTKASTHPVPSSSFEPDIPTKMPSSTEGFLQPTTNLGHSARKESQDLTATSASTQASSEGKRGVTQSPADAIVKENVTPLSNKPTKRQADYGNETTVGRSGVMEPPHVVELKSIEETTEKQPITDNVIHKTEESSPSVTDSPVTKVNEEVTAAEDDDEKPKTTAVEDKDIATTTASIFASDHTETTLHNVVTSTQAVLLTDAENKIAENVTGSKTTTVLTTDHGLSTAPTPVETKSEEDHGETRAITEPLTTGALVTTSTPSHESTTPEPKTEIQMTTDTTIGSAEDKTEEASAATKTDPTMTLVITGVTLTESTTLYHTVEPATQLSPQNKHDIPTLSSTSSASTLGTIPSTTTPMSPQNGNVPSEKLTERADYGLLVFAGFCTVLIIMISVIGNTMTLLVIATNDKLKKAASYFIVSLCISDMMYAVFDLPLFATRYFNVRSADLTTQEGLCTFVPFIQYYSSGVSMFSIGFVSINRFIMVAYCKFYDRIYTKRNTIMMIVVYWAGMLAMCLPTLLGKWGKFGLDKNMHYCSIIEDDNGITSKSALIATGSILPLIAIVVSYTGIFVVVHRSETRMQKHRSHSFTPVSNSVDSQGRLLRLSEAERKVTKMILVVFISFLVCYLPNFFLKIVDKKADHANWQIISYLLFYASCCVNPIIYAVINKEYKTAYRDLAICIKNSILKCRPLGSQPHQEVFRMKKRKTYTANV